MRKRKTDKANPIKAWMQAATVQQQEMLAQFADTTRTYLYQLSSEARKPSAALAVELERASIRVARIFAKKNQAAPGHMRRESLCPGIFGPLES